MSTKAGTVFNDDGKFVEKRKSTKLTLENKIISLVDSIDKSLSSSTDVCPTSEIPQIVQYNSYFQYSVQFLLIFYINQT